MSEARMAFENQYDSDYLGRDDAGYYKWMSTQEEWELWDSAWQAARAGQAASEPVAEVAQVGGTPVVFWDKSLTVGTKLYTHPASAAPDEEYLRALQDAFDILQADANTERNYEALCRVGATLKDLKAKQEQDK